MKRKNKSSPLLAKYQPSSNQIIFLKHNFDFRAANQLLDGENRDVRERQERASQAEGDWSGRSAHSWLRQGAGEDSAIG